MRLLSLDLLAYGPFRGLSLDFSAPGIHVVLGRNEAGKSTTLRAITGLLFGIDAKTSDAHVHKMADLRIAGVLENAAKQHVRVVRRKGNANTLLGAGGEPIDDSVMKKLLAGVSKESFVHAFGLTHEALAAGAQALLEGRGDLGESLFDASVGGGGEVQRLVAELRAEAERIYKPRGTTLPLNDALKLFADAQRAVRERESKPEAFIAQERGLAEAVAEQEAALKERAELEARRKRFERARRRAPLERRQQRASERVAQLGRSLEHVERVGALKERFSAYRHAYEQRGALGAESERLSELVSASVRRAGLASNDADALRLDARTETRINGLLRERTKLVAALEATRADLAKHERELARLSEASASASSCDPAALGMLSSAIERARNLGDVDARLALRKTQLERKHAELHARAVADGLFTGTLEAYLALRVPSVASVRRAEARFEDTAQAIARVDERVASLEAEVARIDTQIAVRTGDFAPPDASSLHGARSARDAAWSALNRATEMERRALEIDVERLLREADAVADRMIREADRVTALAQLRSEAATKAAQREKLARERERMSSERAIALGELATLFADAGITPPIGGAFAEMTAWLERHARITDDHVANRAAENELRDDEQKSLGVRQDVASTLAAAGGDLSPPQRLAELIAAAAHWLATEEAARRSAEETSRAIVKVRIENDDRLAAKERDETALAEVSSKLAALITPLGVPVDASAEEVSRSIEAFRDLFALTDKRADVEARARAFDATVRDFERDLSRTLGELAPDLAALEIRDAAPMFFARAHEAQEAMHELARVAGELETEGDMVLDEAERALVADADDSARALEELDERIEEMETRIRRAYDSVAGLRHGLERMSAESNAAEASANAQLHLARIREHVERWCRVRLAEHVLSREIERYRQENQGPLLGASSELFARLTLGSFSGIKAGFDDKDRPCLRCVRADRSTEVDMAGLSDGTRDQLYLSLRLASLLRRAEVLEPMPVVLDDVLIQVDDQRAAAALAVLAEVSRKMQVLFFTHHARLVDLARSSVAASELTVHELANARPAEEAVATPA